MDRSRGPFRAGRLQNGAVAEHSVSRQASGVHGNVSNGQFLSRKSSKHSIFVSFQRFSIKVIQIVFLFAFSSFFFFFSSLAFLSVDPSTQGSAALRVAPGHVELFPARDLRLRPATHLGFRRLRGALRGE